MTEVINVLNKQVADWNLLFVKLHSFHWNVKGASFFTLHEKFEELYDQAAEHIDELAERILSLKGVPASTMKEYLELSTIEEATGKESAEEMVQSLFSDYAAVIKDLKAGMEIADRHDDEITSDMLLAIKAELEKHVWMFSAYLG